MWHDKWRVNTWQKKETEGGGRAGTRKCEGAKDSTAQLQAQADRQHAPTHVAGLKQMRRNGVNTGENQTVCLNDDVSEDKQADMQA